VNRRLASSLALAVYLFLALSRFSAAAERVAAPRSVESLLQELVARGIDVIYSSYLVPPDLLVAEAEAAAAADPVQAARLALAVHGLELRQIGTNRYVVARAATPRPRVVEIEAELDVPQEVSVYASRYAIPGRALAEPRSLDGPEIDAIPGARDDALRALRALPGLASNASARPHIRGSLSEDVLVRYDGITLLDPYHLKNFQSLFSAIDPAAIERIEVFSGGFPVKYGTRSGGVIDITAPSIASGYDNRLSASLIAAGVSSLGRAEHLPLEWFGAIRRSTLDLLEPVENELGRPRFGDSLGRLRWTTANGAWTAGWLLLDDQLELGRPEDAEIANARYRDEYLWLARDHRFGPSWQTRVTAVVTAAERRRSGEMDTPQVVAGSLDESQRFDRFELTNDWSWAPGGSSSYSFGAELSVSRSRYEYAREVEFEPRIAAAFGRSPVDSLRLSIAPEVVAYSLYGANRRQWARFEAELGLRFDGQRYDGQERHAQLSPRLNLRYDLSERTRLYASVGRFSQAQHIEEWRVEEGQRLADPAQLSIHSVLGLTYQTARAARWSIEAYSKRWPRVSPHFDNLLDPLSLLPELAPDRLRIVPTSSEASGLELNLRTPLAERLSAWGSLSWSRVADDFESSDVLRSWDQSLAVSAGIAWQGPRLALSALAGWHRGWPRTSFGLIDPVGGAPGSLALGARNRDRWGSYYSLDLRSAWTWTLAGGELTATLELTNSTNRANPCCATLSSMAPGGLLEVETDHWLPAIANLGFAYRWRRE